MKEQGDPFIACGVAKLTQNTFSDCESYFKLR